MVNKELALLQSHSEDVDLSLKVHTYVHTVHYKWKADQ